MKKPSASHPRHALGGTLIGFVAGLLVGLGAALAVAVYVTKVPVPFVDRGLSRDAGADAKEAERNKGWNPNAAATRTPGAPTPAAPAAPEANTGAIVVPPADGKALPAPATGSAARPAADPLGELAQQRAGQAPAPATTTAAAAPAKTTRAPTWCAPASPRPSWTFPWRAATTSSPRTPSGALPASNPVTAGACA